MFHVAVFCTGAFGSDNSHLPVCEAPQHSAGMSQTGAVEILALPSAVTVIANCRVLNGKTSDALQVLY